MYHGEENTTAVAAPLRAAFGRLPGSTDAFAHLLDEIAAQDRSTDERDDDAGDERD